MLAHRHVCTFSIRVATHNWLGRILSPFVLPEDHRVSFRTERGSGLSSFSVWDLEELEPQEKMPSGREPSRTLSCQPSRLSLVQMLAQVVNDGTTFVIEKSSVRCWDQPNFSFEQFYAASGQSFDYDTPGCMAPLSDCPRCVIAFVANTLMTNREPFPGDYVFFSVRVYGGGESMTTMFKLRCTNDGGIAPRRAASY